MKSIIILLVSLLVATQAFSQKNTNKELADSLAKSGVTLINRGLYNEALEVFDEAMRLNPDNIFFPYEKALAFYQKKQFDSSVVVLESLKSWKDVNENVFQLLGNSYSYLQKNDLARSTYIEGLNAFPNSGRLYYELGILDYSQNNQKSAMYSWEKGIKQDPFFPNNYFQLTHYYEVTDEYSWAILYGEIFLNLSENTSRIDYMSNQIHVIYNKAFLFKNAESKISPKFSRSIINAKDLKSFPDLPLEVAVDTVMKLAAESILGNDTNKISIKRLHQIRSNFVKIWYKESWDKLFKVPLFDFWKKMETQKVFELYNYWVFKKGAEEEFLSYASKNVKSFEKLGKWMEKNRFVIDKNNYTFRIQK